MLDRELNTGVTDGGLMRQDGAAAGWAVSPGRIGYPEAVEAMKARAAAIAAGEAGELVWLLEHPPLYTAGVSAKADDLLDASRFPVFQTGRGGQFTYHGPGQRVAYVMLDLRRRGRDVGAFVRALEAWIIAHAGAFNVAGETRPGRVGVWVERRQPGARPREDKIAAIGVRVSRWVSFHGISLNLDPDLSHYDGIVPCGITEHGVTSLLDLGCTASMDEVDAALRSSFQEIFGPTVEAQPPICCAASQGSWAAGACEIGMAPPSLQRFVGQPGHGRWSGAGGWCSSPAGGCWSLPGRAGRRGREGLHGTKGSGRGLVVDLHAPSGRRMALVMMGMAGAWIDGCATAAGRGIGAPVEGGRLVRVRSMRRTDRIGSWPTSRAAGRGRPAARASRSPGPAARGPTRLICRGRGSA